MVANILKPNVLLQRKEMTSMAAVLNNSYRSYGCLVDRFRTHHYQEYINLTQGVEPEQLVNHLHGEYMDEPRKFIEAAGLHAAAICSTLRSKVAVEADMTLVLDNFKNDLEQQDE